jgi:hypothetical protein
MFQEIRQVNERSLSFDDDVWLIFGMAKGHSLVIKKLVISKGKLSSAKGGSRVLVEDCQGGDKRYVRHW